MCITYFAVKYILKKIIELLQFKSVMQKCHTSDIKQFVNQQFMFKQLGNERVKKWFKIIIEELIIKIDSPYWRDLLTNLPI